MRFRAMLSLERTQGGRADPSLVQEMLEEEIPEEIWVEDTCYQVTVETLERASEKAS